MNNINNMNNMNNISKLNNIHDNIIKNNNKNHISLSKLYVDILLNLLNYIQYINIYKTQNTKYLNKRFNENRIICEFILPLEYCDENNNDIIHGWSIYCVRRNNKDYLYIEMLFASVKFS